MTTFRLASAFVVVSALAGCGGKGGDGGGGPQGPMGNMALQVTANLKGAAGLLVVEEGQQGASLMLAHHNETAKRLGLTSVPELSLADLPALGLADEAASKDGGLKKVTSAGAVGSVLTTETNADPNMGMKQQLPAIRTIAISPQQEVFLHFERSFQYKDAPPGVDSWDMKNGYQCQIFKVKGGNLDALTANAPSAENLECLDNQHFIDSWQAQRNSVFQFDAQGNLYYPGSIPNEGGKTVVYKRDRTTGEISEMINSNIQVQDFLVTDGGGMFYTGTTGQNHGGGNGGFFRYIAANGALMEIARNWWNFIFEPFQDDKAIFFGPDPRSSTTASWNTACLFEFDPAGGSTVQQRTDEAITCGSDIWRWVNMERPEDLATYPLSQRNIQQSADSTTINNWMAYRTEQKTRCESEGQVFAGGGSQISAVRRSEDDKTYLVGNVRKKRAGTYTCQVQVKGPHCVIEGVPYVDATHDTSGECSALGGTWKDNGRCNLHGDGGAWWGGVDFATKEECLATLADATDYNGNNVTRAEWAYENENYSNVASPLCTQAGTTDHPMTLQIWQADVRTVDSDTLSEDQTAKTYYQPEWANCQAPASTGGDSWSEELSALAVVDDTSKTLDLLSSTTEQAINVFVLGTEVFYSSFNTSVGRYQLRKVKTGDIANNYVVKDNFEVYSFGKSPMAGKAFFNGLDFSNNSYVFGTVATTPANGSFASEVKQGVTGTVRTIVTID